MITEGVSIEAFFEVIVKSNGIIQYWFRSKKKQQFANGLMLVNCCYYILLKRIIKRVFSSSF
jgi:hypothetical protein